ncbi:MAG: hypothetical protein ACYSTY_03670 [Planctomycetota bacterium]|jgi:hypothetical protein
MFILAYGDFEDLLREDNFLAIVAVTMGCLTGMVAIVGGVIGSVMRARARELTKRELAAYVAEGTLDPDKAVAMINAGRPKWEACGDWGMDKKA